MATHAHAHAHKPQWQRLSAKAEGPGPRSSHALVFVEPSFVYALYGELTPRVPVDDKGAVYRLDLGAKDDPSWERVETTTTIGSDADDARPPPCIAPAAAAIGKSIYVFGGRTAVGMGQGTLGHVYRLDTDTMAWEKVWATAEAAEGADASTAPAARSYHAAASLGGKLFVFGGCGPSGRLNDLWAFDPEGRSWERMPDPPVATVPPRGGASLAADVAGGRLVLVGGFDGQRELADAHAFDVARREWCSGPSGCGSCSGAEPTLPARSVLGVAVHAGCGGGGGAGGGAGAGADEACAHVGHVVAFGGECDPSVTRSHDTAGKFMGDAWCGDASGGTWHPLEFAADGGGERPGPRGWFASCAVPGGGMVLHGGLDASNERLADCWRLRF